MRHPMGPPSGAGDAVPFDTLVQGPPALTRALSQIGLIDDEATGEALQSALAPGQMLVSEEGAVWRWDGYTIRRGTPTAAAVRLQQRNRLSMLRGNLVDANARADRGARGVCRGLCRRAGRHRRRAARPRGTARGRAGRRAGAAGGAAAAGAGHHGRRAAERAGRADHGPARRARRGRRGRGAGARGAGRAGGPAGTANGGGTGARARSGAHGRRRPRRGARGIGWRASRPPAAQRRGVIASERTDWAQRAADAAGRVADLAARRAEAEAEHAALAEAPGTDRRPPRRRAGRAGGGRGRASASRPTG